VVRGGIMTTMIREEILKELNRREQTGSGRGLDGMILSLAEDYGIYPDEFMNTLTSNTQSQALYSEAVDEILTVLENDFNFYTDTQFDPAVLKARIVNIIQKKVEGNINYAPSIR